VKEYFDRKEREKLFIDNRKWREEIYFQSVKDTLYSIHLIWDCITGTKDFVSFCLSLTVDSILENFHTEVLQNKQRCEEAEMQELDLFPFVLAWLSNHRPPKMLQEDVEKIKDIGVEYLSQSTKQNLLEWVCYLRKHIRFQENTVDLICRLEGVLLQVDQLFIEEKPC